MTLHLLIGPTASGKSTVLNHLGNRGLTTIESSDYIKAMQAAEGVTNAYQLVEKYNPDGLSFVGTMSAQRIRLDMHEEGLDIRAGVLISGLRIVSQVEYLLSHFPEAQLIGLYATPEVCFTQHQQRKGREQYASLDEFVEKKLEPDYQLGLREIMRQFIPAENRIYVTGNKERLLKQVDKLIATSSRPLGVSFAN